MATPTKTQERDQQGRNQDREGREQAQQQLGLQPGQPQQVGTGQQPGGKPGSGMEALTPAQQKETHAQHEKDNNPTTAKLRQYGQDAPGMHPANLPEDRLNDQHPRKGTRLDLEDITGNPGHRGVNPDAPGGSINRGPNHPPSDKERKAAGRNLPVGSLNMPPDVEPPPRPEKIGSINEPAGSDVRRGIEGDGENTRQLRETGGVGSLATGTTPPAGQGTAGSINEPAGSTIGSNMPQEGAAPPVLSSLEPESVTIGEATAETFTLTVTGSGFTEESVIVFDDEDLDTEFLSDTMLSAEAPTSPEAKEVDVEVANGEDLSEAITFAYEEAAPASAGRTRKPPQRKPSKGKRDKSKAKTKSRR